MLLSEIKKVHCLFEQSGHFKKVFKSIGIDSYDYDIENQFNETDYVIDLFKEIENAYQDKKSIFDNFNKDDLIFAFFPCIRFFDMGQLLISCHSKDLVNLTVSEKSAVSIKYFSELNNLFSLLNMLVAVCFNRSLRLIIENPYCNFRFLNRYFAFDPSVIIDNRFKYGDYFEKPTQFWFFNINLYFQFNHYLPVRQTVISKVKNNRFGIFRSLISDEFIKWFIQEYIIEDIDFNIPP